MSGFNLQILNGILLVVILIILLVICFKKNNERFKDTVLSNCKKKCINDAFKDCLMIKTADDLNASDTRCDTDNCFRLNNYGVCCGHGGYKQNNRKSICRDTSKYLKNK
jgi:hypothetical protein